MKSRLSATGYIKNNKRTCFVLILALGLTFMAMYIIAFILGATTESFRPIIFEYPRRISFAEVTTNAYSVKRSDYETIEEYAEAYGKEDKAFFEALSNDPDVTRVYDTQFLNATYNGVIGGIGYEFPLLPAEEIPFVAEHLGTVLTSGRMPEGEGEVVIDEIILKNGKMKIGDWFLENSYGQVFKVVGTLRSDGMACLGTPRGSYNNGWGFVVLCNDNSKDFTKLAAKYGVHVSEENGDNISDAVTYKELWDKNIAGTIDSVMKVILLVVMIFLTISVLIAYISFMRNRVNEYCLYASIGYSKGEIYGMIMREMIILFLSGIVLGVITSLGMMKLLDMTVMEPRGLVSAWFMKDQLGRILGAFAVIVGILQIPVMLSVHKIKTIDLMED